MIYELIGAVSEVQDSFVVVQVGGIGFCVNMALPNSCEINKQIKLYTVLHWNQDHGPSVYGFKTQTERKLFKLVTGCSGIGPKMGLSVLRDLSPQELVQAIEQEDINALSKVSGIGKKKAEHIIVYLKHKIADNFAEDDSVAGSFSHWKDVSQALSSLGYSTSETSNARAYIQKQVSKDSSFDQVLRLALSFLSKK